MSDMWVWWGVVPGLILSGLLIWASCSCAKDEPEPPEERPIPPSMYRLAYRLGVPADRREDFVQVLWTMPLVDMGEGDVLGSFLHRVLDLAAEYGGFDAPEA